MLLFNELDQENPLTIYNQYAKYPDIKFFDKKFLEKKSLYFSRKKKFN